MYLLEKDFTFEASHQLPNHDGKCARLHGHSWKMTVSVAGNELVHDGPKADMLMDYGSISFAVKVLIGNYLDHWHLNDTTGLANPTSERLAKWVYEKLVDCIEEYGVTLTSITIQETCTAKCTYVPDPRFFLRDTHEIEKETERLASDHAAQRQDASA